MMFPSIAALAWDVAPQPQPVEAAMWYSHDMAAVTAASAVESELVADHMGPESPKGS